MDTEDDRLGKLKRQLLTMWSVLSPAVTNNIARRIALAAAARVRVNVYIHHHYCQSAINAAIF